MVLDAAVSLARLAYGRFGKGVGDPGVLDYGDCLAYGLAMALGSLFSSRATTSAGRTS